MKFEKTPKYKIGEKVFAFWAGGRVTTHTIAGIEETKQGFWYTWDDADDNIGNGLHEHHLSKA